MDLPSFGCHILDVIDEGSELGVAPPGKQANSAHWRTLKPAIALRDVQELFASGGGLLTFGFALG